MKPQYITMFLLLCVLCTGQTFLSAQSTADEIEALLNNSAVTYGQAARFVLEAADVTVTTDPAEAFQYAAQRNWLPKTASANEAARLDGISLLFMHSFGIKGGLLYSITKSSHYAYRDMVYRNLIQGRVDPAMNVSGERLLFITSRIFSLRGENEEQ